MHIDVEGQAIIRHKATGERYTFDADDLDWSSASAGEAPMGARIEHIAEIDHPTLGPISWSLWEYPQGATEYVDQDLNGHELIENFRISLEHDPEDSYDDDSSTVAWDELSEEEQAEQVEAMVDWFRTNYEDPQSEMPYADRDSPDNYDYPWGGPYDAEEEIRGEFEGQVAEEAIRLAVEKVTDDGTFDWAPTSQHPDRRRLEAGNFDAFEDDDALEVEGDDIFSAPAQRPAPLKTIERNGRVARATAVSAATSQNPYRQSGHAAIVEALDDFEAGFPAHNHPGLRRALVRLRDSLGPTPDDIDVVRLGTAAERVNQYAIRADEILMADMAAEVTALNISLTVNLSHFDEWAAYKDGLAADPEASDADIEAAQVVVDALAGNELLEPEVHAELEAERVPFILPLEGDRGTGIERKSFLRSVSNTLSTIVNMSAKYIKDVGVHLKTGHMKAWEKVGENATLALITIAMTPLSTLAAGHPYFAFLLPILTFVSQFTDKK